VYRQNYPDPEFSAMPVSLNRIVQIALAVQDVDRAETFYQTTLGLRRLYRFGDLAFFDCAGVRLLLEKAGEPEAVSDAAPIYFACVDIALTVRELQQEGVVSSAIPTDTFWR
jgi:methylmalonyl-CoA/ethylmalonyl-CoA epimerase